MPPGHDQAARQYSDEGVTIVRAVLSAAEVAELRAELERYLRDVIPTHPEKDVFYEDTTPSGSAPGSGKGRSLKSAFRLHERSAYFQALMTHARLGAIVRAIFPDGEILNDGGVMYFAKPARDGSVTPPHQDNAFQNWKPPLALTATLAVDRSTPENGVLTVSRGSHKLGLLPHRQSGVMGFSRCLIDPIDEKAYPPIQVLMEPGDVALHHINAVHFSGANQSPHPRRQIGIAFRAALAQRDAEAFGQYQKALDEMVKGKAR